MILSSAARTGLQHFHSRIGQYYADPKRAIAHTLLGQVSMSGSGLRGATLLQETERLLADLGVTLPAHERRQMFNQLLLDLENDFYIVEVEGGGLRLRQRRVEILVEEIPCLNRPPTRISACTDPA